MKKTTEELMKTCKPGGKFIMHSADSLEYGAPMENVEAHVEIAFEYVAY